MRKEQANGAQPDYGHMSTVDREHLKRMHHARERLNKDCLLWVKASVILSQLIAISHDVLCKRIGPDGPANDSATDTDIRVSRDNNLANDFMHRVPDRAPREATAGTHQQAAPTSKELRNIATTQPAREAAQHDCAGRQLRRIGCGCLHTG